MQRVIGHLLREHEMSENANDETFTVALPASKATIASRLSLTPEYFFQGVTGASKKKGLIEMDKRDIRIVDALRLQSYVQ